VSPELSFGPSAGPKRSKWEDLRTIPDSIYGHKTIAESGPITLIGEMAHPTLPMAPNVSPTEWEDSIIEVHFG
jgi:hypothetical protein